MKNWTLYWTKLVEASELLLKSALLFLVAVYRTIGSQHLGGQCRFQPSCSQYAIDALKTHRVFPALGLILKRISRCHPLGSSGWDPVPSVKGGSYDRR